MINRNQNALFKYTIEYIEENNYYQRCFQRSRQETLDTIFKESYIEVGIFRLFSFYEILIASDYDRYY